MKKTILALTLLLGSTAVGYGQQQVCISQETANTCAEAIDRVTALEDAIRERDRIIEGLKVEVARQTQKAVDYEATVVRMTGLLELMLKSYTKPKKFGLINF
jgi:hypothetical protein